jgi:hypothetical protein
MFTNSQDFEQDFLMRWNGSVWTMAASPFDGQMIEGMAAGPGGTVWAVGTDQPSNDSVSNRAASMRWDGKSWRKLPMAIPATGDFHAVAVIPGGTVWAVGSMYDSQNLIAQWTGRAWQKVASPTPCPNKAAVNLNAVDATSARNAWAVGACDGATGNSDATTMILHWNGRTWS